MSKILLYVGTSFRTVVQKLYFWASSTKLVNGTKKYAYIAARMIYKNRRRKRLNLIYGYGKLNEEIIVIY